MPICSKTDMPELQCLRLNAKRIRGSDISALTNLQLDTLFLNLEDLSEYRAASTPVFNAKTIQIVSPHRDFHILADVELNATESLELLNIHDEQVNELRTFLLKLSRSGRLRNLTLHNMQCSWGDFISILQAAWETTVEHLVISNAAWMDATAENNFNYAKTSLKTLEIKETIIVTIKADPIYMYRIFSEMNITALTISVVFAAIISFLCIYLDIPWYLKMMWQWTQVKHRIWKNNPEDVLDNLEFHAFVSYSERDSDWVKNVLIPNLEKEDGSIQICQHERNFIAGKSIVENIIDSIEKSYRSIFVLSPNFVQSEWCHYELYFAHHKLFQERNNSLILLLLEPIPPYIIPAKYYKLKALMAKRTYLEWPKEKGKQGLFWANLRATICVRLPEK
ncbi:UNVERIFIED_CONTAM: hypothetical protein K2H54_057181 [Gekko kuhli]